MSQVDVGQTTFYFVPGVSALGLRVLLSTLSTSN
jgi:hypothetical protein